MSRKMWIILGALLIIAVIVTAVHAQAPGYAKSTKCKMCHGAMHKPICDGWAKTSHAKACLEPTDENAIVADFANGAPFKKEDVKYVLGKGRNLQAYVDADFKTLPGMWDVKKKKWAKQEVVDASNQCIGCHSTGFDAASKTWSEKGVGCESCHGNGAQHAEMGAKDKIVNPANLQGDKKNAVCAQCHARGTDTTKKFAWPTTWKYGDPIEPAFVLASVVPGAQNQQYNEMKASKHFAAGLTCTTCHESHGVKTDQPDQLKKPVNDLCYGCHANIKEEKDHPAVPENATCAMCHMPQGMHTFKAPE